MDKSYLLRTDKEITEIYYRNVQSVFRVALMYLGNSHDAEDVVQNVFIKFIDTNQLFNDEKHERAWFITVTKNICKNMLKCFWRMRQEDIEGVELPPYIENFNEQNEVLEKVKSLKSNYRVVIYLYYYEGYSVKEIAEVLNKSESTVQTWLARAREKLRVELGKDGDVYEAR